MLVLSRRPDEKILLPTVPAVIKLISVHAGLARLGIVAPDHVPILRAELCRHTRPTAGPTPPAESLDGTVPNLCHFIRDRLNNLILGLALLRMSLVECDPSVRQTLDGMEEELQALRLAVAEPAERPQVLSEEVLATQTPA
jgi:carbon storage regulator CsrA